MAECNPIHQMVEEIGGLIVRIPTQSGRQIWKLSLGRIFRVGEGSRASTTFDRVELYGTLRLVQRDHSEGCWSVRCTAWDSKHHKRAFKNLPICERPCYAQSEILLLSFILFLYRS
jgi:hypothetical protein